MMPALWLVDLARAFWCRNEPDHITSSTLPWDDGTAEFVARPFR